MSVLSTISVALNSSQLTNSQKIIKKNDDKERTRRKRTSREYSFVSCDSGRSRVGRTRSWTA